MINILIAPDSFKGSLSALKVADIIAHKLSNSGLPVCITCCPLADGGEGSLDAINQVLNFVPVKIKAMNPQFIEMDSMYIFSKTESTAYIELAQASGIGLIKGKNDILHASTYGTGQLMKHAIDNEISKLVLFLGGSASCDAGLGIANALGVKFLGSDKKPIIPSALNMIEIRDFDLSSSIVNAKSTEIILAVDVNNPFYGINGASVIYSPQKGANPEQVKLLDKGLMNMAQLILKKTGIDLQHIPGSGAAGGTAGGLIAFLGAKISKGTDFIFKLIGIEELIKQSDLVISGEGKIDYQSLNNKLLYGIAQITSKYNKPLWTVCGFFEGDSQLKKDLYLERVFSLSKSKEDIWNSVLNAEQELIKICENLLSEIKSKYFI